LAGVLLYNVIRIDTGGAGEPHPAEAGIEVPYAVHIVGNQQDIVHGDASQL
jgi:hypothetical protein